MKRGIDNIAYDIIFDWSNNLTNNIPQHIKPFLNAMIQLVSPDDSYGYDSAREIVCLFIMNAEEIYHTENSERLLNELKELVEWEED
jgi:hypothetical protein